MKSKRLLFAVGALLAAGGAAPPAYTQAPTPSENTGSRARDVQLSRVPYLLDQTAVQVHLRFSDEPIFAAGALG